MICSSSVCYRMLKYLIDVIGISISKEGNENGENGNEDSMKNR